MNEKIKTIKEKTNEPKRKIIIGIFIFIFLIIGFKFFQWRTSAINSEQKDLLTASKKAVDVTDTAVISLDKQAALENKINDVRMEKEILEDKIVELLQKDTVRQAELEDLMTKLTKVFEDLNQTKSLTQQESATQQKSLSRIEEKILSLSKENKKIVLPPLQIPGISNSRSPLEKKELLVDNAGAQMIVEKKADTLPKKENDVVAFSFFSSSTEASQPAIANMNSASSQPDIKDKEGGKEPPIVIRMGFVDAVSLTGVKVPVQSGGATAPSDTYPIFFKIGARSLGSNNHTQDLRNCIAMAAARGNRNSNRVLAHITKVSCTDPSGTRRYEAAVDGDGLNGYVYGDDNMLGISGVKEDLSGEHIGKAILASFAEGVANAFSKVPSMVGITGEVTDTGASTFTDGFASGSSQSLEFIAKYYLEQAKSFLPVISIKAGRKVAIGFAADMEFKSVEFKTVFVNTPYEYKPSDTLMDDTKKPKLSLN